MWRLCMIVSIAAMVVYMANEADDSDERPRGDHQKNLA